MSSSHRLALLVFFGLVFVSGKSPADVSLAGMFNDNCVLQRDIPPPVWGWADPQEQVTVELNGEKETAQAGADGRWQVNFKPMSAGGQISVLYCGMIAPIVRFAVRGAIWYQGESDAQNPAQYRTLFPDMIRDWRTQWKAKQDGSEFRFFFVQLPKYKPMDGGDWPQLREAQAMALAVPGTAMAIAIDTGDAGAIHPPNKQQVCDRLSRAARALEYGEKIEYSSPLFKDMKIDGNKARIEFTHADGLKTSDTASPLGFTLQSDDDKWYPAVAFIDGTSVVLSSDKAPHPKAVHYAFENVPDVNLINCAGVPAAPFRTAGPPPPP